MNVSGEWLLNFSEMEECTEDSCETGMPALRPGSIRGKWQLYVLRVEDRLSACLKVAINM